MDTHYPLASNAPAEESQPPGAGQACQHRRRHISRRDGTICQDCGAQLDAPPYRPLAPDEVPQVGDEVQIRGSADWKVIQTNAWNRADYHSTFAFRTTRPAPKPTPDAGTPLTDAVKMRWKQHMYSPSIEVVPVELSADLESKLAVANAEITRLIPLAYETRPGMEIPPVTWQQHSQEILRQLYATQDERDALRNALEKIQSYGSEEKPGLCPYGCDCPQIATDALTTKGGAK